MAKKVRRRSTFEAPRSDAEILWEESPKVPYEQNKRKGIFTFVGVSLVAAMGLAIMGLPAVAFTNLGVNALQDVISIDLPKKFEINNYMERSNVYAVNSAGQNVLLASFFDQNREVVDWDNVSTFMKDASVATEDPRFYEHGGIDVQGLARAIVVNAQGKDIQGGSSITQQFIKNILIQEAEKISDPTKRQAAYKKATEQSITRKVTEMQYALAVEKKYSKKDILLGYFNIVGFGGQIYGVQAASQYYYGIPAKDLNLNQSATLTAILNSPNEFRIDKPDQESNNAADGYAETKKRRDYVLSRMLTEGYITQEQYDTTVAEPITPVITQPSTGCVTAGGAAYFCDYVTKIIENDPVFGKTPEARKQLLQQGGLQIYTTLNVDVQASAEQAMAANVPQTVSELQLGAAVSSIENKTGRILAMAQNKKYTQDPLVAATDPAYSAINYNTDFAYGGSTGFQTGSTYKLVTLVNWLENGHKVYETVNNKGVVTEMTNTCDPSGKWTGNYEFKNADGSRGSWGSVYYGTQQSLNSTFIGMAQKLDLCSIDATAKKLGIHRADGNPLNIGPAAVIGTNEIAPLSMANAYGTIADGGTHCNPIAIDKVIDKNGKSLEVPQSDCVAVVNPDVAAAINSVMGDIIKWGFAAKANPRDGVPMMAKTGTTDNAVDSYLVASSTNVSTAVWVGNTIGKVSLQEIREIQGEQVKYPIVKQVAATANSIYGGDAFAPAPNSLMY